MFTQPAPASSSPGLVLGSTHQVATASGSPASPTRPSRLRGFSYIRQYTQSHILSREHSGSGAGSPSANTAPNSTVTDSSAAPNFHGRSNTTSNHFFRPGRATANRLTLVDLDTHPLSLTPPPVRPTAERRATDSALPPVLVPLVAEPTTGLNTSAESMIPSEQAQAETTPAMTRTRAATVSDAPPHLDILPSIRFSTFYDPRAPRPSLTFSPVSRTLPTGSEVIRVGRYSERDNQPNVPPNVPSAAPVGFKSKVVSRRHCEFWYEEGKWYIKDVKSSSGTFLNHIRLSPPGTESKPFPINDGDIVQLGIDFKGGEEMIFRCVKMRLELNRGWQNKLNTFNMNTHKKLRTLISGSTDQAGSSSQSSAQDCSICLNNIAPCQCLFVAPCSHTWHYKCIRSLLSSPSYPIFICPNCRAAADLEAEVEDPEDWEQVESDEGAKGQRDGAETLQANALPAPRRSRESARGVLAQQPQVTSPEQAMPAPALPAQYETDVMDMTMHDVDLPPPTNHEITTNMSATRSNALFNGPLGLPRPPNNRSVSLNATSVPIGIPNSRSASSSIPVTARPGTTRTPSPTGPGQPAFMSNGEGPITPRNNEGPWVFDGSGVRSRLGDTAGASISAGTAPNGDEMDL